MITMTTNVLSCSNCYICLFFYKPLPQNFPHPQQSDLVLVQQSLEVIADLSQGSFLNDNKRNHMPRPPLWVCQCSSTALCQWKMGWVSHSQLFGLYSQPQGDFMLTTTFEASRCIRTARPGTVFQLRGPDVHCRHILLACQDAVWVCNCLPSLPFPPCHTSWFPLERKLGLRAGEWVLWWTSGLASHSVSYGSPQAKRNTLQSSTWHSQIAVGWAVASFWAPETHRLALQQCF